MDPPVPELQGGQQEQELRQLLNKDKSKRSKGRAPLPRPVPGCLGGMSGKGTVYFDALCWFCL